MGIFDGLGGFLKDLGTEVFKPANIVGGLEAFGQIAGKNSAQDSIYGLENLKYEHQMGMADKELENQIKLLQLKASLGGGGGGGGGGGAAAAALAYQKQKDRYEARLQTMRDAMGGQQQSSSQVVQALLNLADLAQKPGLIR